MGLCRKLPSRSKEMNRNDSSLGTFRVKEIWFLHIKNPDKDGLRPSWLSKDLLAQLKYKNEMHQYRNQEHVSWEEYRDAI